jgi:hypothetical protein
MSIYFSPNVHNYSGARGWTVDPESRQDLIDNYARFSYDATTNEVIRTGGGLTVDPTITREVILRSRRRETKRQMSQRAIEAWASYEKCIGSAKSRGHCCFNLATFMLLGQIGLPEYSAEYDELLDYVCHPAKNYRGYNPRCDRLGTCVGFINGRRVDHAATIVSVDGEVLTMSKNACGGELTLRTVDEEKKRWRISPHEKRLLGAKSCTPQMMALCDQERIVHYVLNG